MTTPITTQTEDRIVSELTAVRQSMDSMKSTMEDKFEIALKPIERGLRSITLIPLAIIFGGTSSWLFYVGKITESTWFWLTVFLMMPFFGEGARVILDKLPFISKTAQVAKVLAFVPLMLAFLTGCPALSDYDRKLTAYVNVTDQTGGLKYSLWGAKQPGKGSLSGDFQIEGSLAEGKQVLSIER